MKTQRQTQARFKLSKKGLSPLPTLQVIQLGLIDESQVEI